MKFREEIPYYHSETEVIELDVHQVYCAQVALEINHPPSIPQFIILDLEQVDDLIEHLQYLKQEMTRDVT